MDFYQARHHYLFDKMTLELISLTITALALFEPTTMIQGTVVSSVYQEGNLPASFIL